MRARTLAIVAFGAALVGTLALTLLRSRQQSADADASVPSATVDELGRARDLVTDHERASATSLRDEAREEALARAREEQEQQWRAQRRAQVLTTPMAEALEDAKVVEGALKKPPSRLREGESEQRLDSKSSALSEGQLPKP